MGAPGDSYLRPSVGSVYVCVCVCVRACGLVERALHHTTALRYSTRNINTHHVNLRQNAYRRQAHRGRQNNYSAQALLLTP
jgi:hypothetical protein